MREFDRPARGDIIEVGLNGHDQSTGSSNPMERADRPATGRRRHNDHGPPVEDAELTITWIGVEWPGSEWDPDPSGTQAMRRPPPDPRPVRFGWSLVIATVANLLLGFTAVATGATLIGVIACTTLSIATCMLVMAEIIGRTDR